MVGDGRTTGANGRRREAGSVPATTVDDLRGLEFDWLAVDADGHVAFLSTAGGGDVPAGVDPDAHDAAIEA